MKEKIISNSPGFGAGEGTTELYIYKCPCGEGVSILCKPAKERDLCFGRGHFYADHWACRDANCNAVGVVMYLPRY